jgi:formylglycine-generating enzyme required for sulfatase activity
MSVIMMISSICDRKNVLLLFSFLLIGSLMYGCESQQEKGAMKKDIIDKKVLENMVLIPAGDFIMGSDEVDKETLQQRFGMAKTPYLNEHPQRKISLGDYYIDKFEITKRQYKEFVNATGRAAPLNWVNGQYAPDTDDHPVFFITWFDADAYCKWAGKRLPTEEEWEKAARGTDGRSFPWGNEFDLKKTNASGKYGGVYPVGHFEEDVSPFGVYDMAGNVQEWTASWYKAYPGNEYEDEDYGEKLRVTKGGGWGGLGHYSFDLFYRTSFRGFMDPSQGFDDLGFRCVLSK